MYSVRMWGDGGDCKGRQMCIIRGFAMEDILEGDCVDKSINILSAMN